MYLKDSNSKCISFDNNQNVTKLKKLFRRRCFDFCALLTIIYYVMSTNSWLCTDYSVVQSKVMFFESANKLIEYQKICKEKTHEYWKEKKRRLYWILSLQRSSQICCRKRLKSSVVIFNAWARGNFMCFKALLMVRVCSTLSFFIIQDAEILLAALKEDDDEEALNISVSSGTHSVSSNSKR